MEKRKIIKQIERLCEKQFRKGFQQGYYACKDNHLTQEQVDVFRINGQVEKYDKVIHPHTNKKELASDRIFVETYNDNFFTELYDFLNTD
jgi:hypothetical protein